MSDISIDSNGEIVLDLFHFTVCDFFLEHNRCIMEIYLYVLWNSSLIVMKFMIISTVA
jgi:hypothetical protein